MYEATMMRSWEVVAWFYDKKGSHPTPRLDVSATIPRLYQTHCLQPLRATRDMYEVSMSTCVA